MPARPIPKRARPVALQASAKAIRTWTDASSKKSMPAREQRDRANSKCYRKLDAEVAEVQ
jgi:hypothetical protein